MKLLLLFISVYSTASEQFLEWGLSARQGDRKRMEDYHLAMVPFRNIPTSGLFGIFDGHSGAETAQIAAEQLPSFIPQNEFFTTEKFGIALVELDTLVLKSSIKDSGSCALIAHVDKNLLHIAWVGDSRALVCRGNDIILATTDHKADHPDEIQMIRERGGWISKFYKDVARVNGILAVSRALGNRSLKANNVLPAMPDIKALVLQPNDILVMACDGVWDVFKNEEVCSLVQKTLTFSKSDLEKLYPQNPLLRENKKPDPMVHEDGHEHLVLAARALRDEAYERGSTDNISVQIIKFN